MEIMSIKELSRYLKTNEQLLYKMVQKSRIPSSKINGKIVFVKEVIDKWVLENTVRERHVYLTGSDDMLLRTVIDVYNSDRDELVYYAPIGSMRGLEVLKEGGATISCVHILDIDKKDYNPSYVQRYLGTDDYVVIHLFMREQGLCLQKGNRKNIDSLEDLTAEGVLFVNRNKGCGTRLLFDYLLHEKGIDPHAIKGYERAMESHSEMETALTVLNGKADAGFCIRHAAHILGLGFTTLARESFDMVVPTERFHSTQVKSFLSFFDQAELVRHVRDFTGYDISRMGQILYPHP